MDETKKGTNGDLKPQHKKTPDRTTMGPTTDIYNQAPTLWNRLRRGRHLVWGPTHRRAIKTEDKVSFLLILYSYYIGHAIQKCVFGHMHNLISAFAVC